MSSCLSGGGGRTYSIDLDIVKSPSSSSTRTTHSSSSPSSTLSESTDSPIKISTRKPRTPRKRPNQTYNEAAALLSTVYPNIFSIKNLKKPFKHSKPCDSFSEESSELLPPFQTFGTAEFLIHPPIPEKPTSRIEPKPVNSSETPCQSPEFGLNSSNPSSIFEDDFDAESILDEEMEESIGIDSIMGNLSVNVNTINAYDHQFNSGLFYNNNININNPYYGRLGFGGKFEYGFGGVSAMRQVDDGDWWRFPTVDVLNISPKLSIKASSEKKKKKKKKKVEVVEVERETEEVEEEDREKELQNFGSSASNKEGKNSSLSLSLKLNYEDVLVAWSDRGSPFSDDMLGTELSESDAIARLAQIDLFAENGGLREASVLRYREKRRTRLFSKKIRYQVRKVNADRRPRMKGRFVRRPTTIRDEEKYKK